MIFRNATLKNFGSYGPNEQVLDLSENGTKLLVAPNGFGKSTLFYSIVFALYGKTNQDSIDDVVNRKTKKNCKTSVEFIENGELYKVIRYRAHEEHGNNVYIFKGDEDISMRKAADTNQLILDIIKMPYQAFINSTFFSTELYSRFMVAKTAERLSVFENLLSLKEINAFYDQGKKFRTIIKEKLDAINVVKAAKTAEISSIESNIKDYTVRAKEALLSLKKEKELLLSSIETNRRKIEEYSSIDVDTELLNNKNKSRFDSLVSQKREKENSYETVSVEKPTEADLSFLESIKKIDFDKERELFDKKNRLSEEITVLTENVNVLKGSATALSNSVSMCVSNISQFNTDITKIDNQLKKLDDNLCVYCGQHVSDEFVGDKRKTLEEEKEALSKKLTEAEKEKEKFTKELEPVSSELREKSEKIISLTEEKITVSATLKFCDISPDVIISRAKANEMKVSIYDREVLRVEETNRKIREEITRIEAELSEVNYTPKYSDEFLLDIRSKIEELDKEIKKCQTLISEVDGKVSSVYDKSFIDSQKEKAAKISKELDVVIADENILKEDDLYYSYLMNCFSNKENSFKKFFIGQMIDTFNEKINQYLPFFFEEDVSIVFDKELECKITIDKDEVSIKSFSAGQKTRADLAVAFALFNLSRIFFSNESNLLIVDEILDTNIDTFGIESALTIVEGFGYDTSVFVVSHNQEIKDKIKEKVEIVRDENKFSVIRQ